MSAMCALSLLCGIDTVSWYAELALRSLVSMSATGSVIVICGAFLAWFRTSVTRKATCGGEGAERMSGPRGGVLLVFGRLEGETERLEQRAAFFVVPGGRHNSDVHTADTVDPVLVDLVEHDLLGETEGVVAAAVELLVREAAEVTDPGKREAQQAVEELPHAVATKRDVRTDGLSFTQFELRDRLACLGDLRLLAGDLGEVCDGAVHDLAVASSLADTHVDNDLHQVRHLVHVREAEVLGELGGDLGAVLRLETRLGFASSNCDVSH